MPRVSVIIPCYNQGHFVHDAVSSVLEQSWQDVEIIIVNDGSTDAATNQLLDTLQQPRTRAITTTNQGLAAARNNGIREAQGEYILPLDADDRIGPNYLEKAIRLLDAQEKLGIVYCRARLFGSVETEWQLPVFSLEQMLLDNVIFCSALFRRKDWQQVGGYDESLLHGWEDYDFWLSLLELGRTVYQIPEILFYYRVSADSMVRARPRQHKLETFARIFRKHQQLYTDHIEVWVDKVLDAGEIYHQAELIVSAGQVPDDPTWIRKVDRSTRRLTYQLPQDLQRTILEFFPAEHPVVVSIHNISLTDDHKEHILSFTHNGDFESDALCFFCSRKPVFRLPLPELSPDTSSEYRLRIELEYHAFGADCIPLLLTLLKKPEQTLSENSTSPSKVAGLPAPKSWVQVNKALVKRYLKSLRYCLPNTHYRTIKQSGLFDAKYYLQQDPNISSQFMDPLIHYVESGWREGRNPNPLFEAIWYRKTYQIPDDQDPLLHYIQEGWQKGNNPNLLFFTSYYATTYSQSIKNGQPPLGHYLHQGWREGYNPNPCFDSAYYLAQNPDVVALGQNPLFHYYHIGNQEQRSPMPFFDMEFYCEDNPKAFEEWLFPLLHYYEYGAAEGRSPTRLFDPIYYRITYDLTELSGIELFFHYVREGSRKNLRPSALFDPTYYAEKNPEYSRTHTSPLSHYQDVGVLQGMYPCREVAALAKKPIISILTPVYNTDERLLRRCIHSVLFQTYPHWELCLVDDGSTAPHIQSLLEEYAAKDHRITFSLLSENTGIAGATNAAAELATGEYLGFLDHDDELTLNALYEMVAAINNHDPDILYSDEDLVNRESRHCDTFYKPAYNAELLLCHNYITHFLVTKRSLFTEIDGLSPLYDGAQDYDLLLRLTEKSSRIYHIAKVLYHWRATETSTSINHSQKDYANEAGLRALQAAVKRRELQADVGQGVMNYFYELHHHLAGNSAVDLFILLENGENEGKRWLISLLQNTNQKKIAVYLIPCNPLSPETELELKVLDSRITVSAEISKENLAGAFNRAVRSAGGEFLCFLDQGILPEESDWLQSLLGYAQQEDIGLVGGLVVDEGKEKKRDFLPDPAASSALALHDFLTQASIHANGLFCPQEVLAVRRGFCMVSREHFLQAGAFDAVRFPTAFFDVDLSLHLRELGQRNVFSPYCKALRSSMNTNLESRTDKLESSSEKIRLQSKWQHVLPLVNAFINPQLILKHTGLREEEWFAWLIGDVEH